MDKTVLTAIITSAGLGTLVSGIISLIFGYQSNRKLASHTAKLNRENQIELEAFKGRLAVEAAERNIRLTRTFEDMARVLAETYKNLARMKIVADELMNGLARYPEKKAAKEDEYTKAVSEFFVHFTENKIYFPPDLAQKVEQYARTVNAAKLQYDNAIAECRAEVRDEGTRGKAFQQCFNTQDLIPKVLEEMEAEFQYVLGLGNKKITDGPKNQITARTS